MGLAGTKQVVLLRVVTEPAAQLAPVPAAVYAAMVNAGMDVGGFTPV